VALDISCFIAFSNTILQQVETRNRKYGVGEIGGGLEGSRFNNHVVGYPEYSFWGNTTLTIHNLINFTVSTANLF
jgi:hypothetical protein